MLSKPIWRLLMQKLISRQIDFDFELLLEFIGLGFFSFLLSPVARNLASCTLVGGWLLLQFRPKTV